jgi:hypothetical protein
MPGTFFLQVIAVVVGGVLLIPAVALLRWLGTPLKWWWRNWEMEDLIHNRREFLLVYQPYAIPPASRMLTLLDEGEIGAGRNDNEYTWRVKHGCLEFLSEDGRLYSRFKIDRANGRLSSVIGRNVRGIFGQYLLPQY